MTAAKRRTQRGMVLILISGLLTLILLLSMTFVQASRAGSAGSEAALAARHARLVAGSGMAYAAGRLWETHLRPAPAAVANRGDDWTQRQAPSSPAGALNPSYSHGESWEDDPSAGTIGTYDPGLDDIAAGKWTDLDGDGKFSAWSGRLRGEGPFPHRFSLSTSAATGLVCINSGEIRDLSADHDLDGILNGDEQADYDADVPTGAHCDPLYPGNVHLVNLLDNLGAVLDLSIETTQPYWTATPALGQIETSTLGTIVLQNRPAGGYTSVEQLRPFLSPSDYARVAPFLSAAGQFAPIPVASEAITELAYGSHFLGTTVSQPIRYEFHARIDFNAAPVEVIAASLRHIAASGSAKGIMMGGTMTPINKRFIRLGAGEADAIATELARQRPIPTWKRFLEVLHGSCAPLFEDDPYTTAVDEASDIERILLKEDLILAQVMPAGYTGDPALWRQNTLEIDREPSGQVQGWDPTRVRMIFKDLLTGPLSTLPFDKSGAPQSSLPSTQVSNGLPPRLTTEYRLSEICPEAFEVSCEGWASAASHRARGTLRLGETCLLAGQRQMELPAVSPSSPWRFPGGSVRAEEKCQKSGVRTYPLFDRQSYDVALLTAAFPLSAANYLACDEYPAAQGGIRLASRQVPAAELAEARFAVPFNEDRYDPAAPSQPEAGTWYNPTDWTDNLGDPLVGSGPGGRRSPPPGQTATSVGLFHMGAQFGPDGFRFRYYSATGFSGSASQSEISYTWDAGWMAQLPFNLDVNGRIVDSTLTFWYPVTDNGSLADSAGLVDGEMRIAFKNNPLLPTSIPYLTVKWPMKGTVEFGGGKFTPGSTQVGAWWTGNPQLKKAGWHHVAVTLDASGQAFLYLDGLPAAGPVPNNTSATTPAAWLLILSPPIDDVRIYNRALLPDEIEEEARKEPYESLGNYRSPRLVFDAGALPRGALVRGLAWDGFIPGQAGGKIVFDAVCYDGGGNVLNPGGPGRGIEWDGAGDCSESFRVPGARQATIEVILEPSPTDLPLGPGGSDIPVLRDSPHVAELSIFFGDARPRWAAFD